jgi:hypothetical protein
MRMYAKSEMGIGSCDVNACAYGHWCECKLLTAGSRAGAYITSPAAVGHEGCSD